MTFLYHALTGLDGYCPRPWGYPNNPFGELMSTGGTFFEVLYIL